MDTMGSIHLYLYLFFHTYVLPILLHGLEALVLNQSDILKLETYYRNLLKHIQHLPASTANAAVYLLLGALPMEGHIDVQTLNFFNRIALSKDTIEWKIVQRQLALNDMTSKSWTVYVRKILRKYNLPSAFELFQNPLEKSQFKRIVKE